MKVTADQGSCVGSGQCVLAAPRLFGQSMETGLVEVLDVTLTEDDVEPAEQAEMTCPVRAVRLER